jgi:hypothetical protein
MLTEVSLWMLAGRVDIMPVTAGCWKLAAFVHIHVSRVKAEVHAREPACSAYSKQGM